MRSRQILNYLNRNTGNFNRGLPKRHFCQQSGANPASDSVSEEIRNTWYYIMGYAALMGTLNEYDETKNPFQAGVKGVTKGVTWGTLAAGAIWLCSKHPYRFALLATPGMFMIHNQHQPRRPTLNSKNVITERQREDALNITEFKARHPEYKQASDLLSEEAHAEIEKHEEEIEVNHRRFSAY